MEENPAKFRSFFAIDLSKEVQEQIVNLIDNIKKQRKYRNIRWSKPENLHLTMRFLGNISLVQYEKIVARVKEGVKDFETFILSFDELIIFPSPQHPIVLALKPEPLLTLLKLNQIIEKNLVNCEVQEEHRTFAPHLTLAKIRGKHHFKAPIIKLPKLNFEVNRLQLYRSDPTEEGAKYTLLTSLAFCKPNSKI